MSAREAQRGCRSPTAQTSRAPAGEVKFRKAIAVGDRQLWLFDHALSQLVY